MTREEAIIILDCKRPYENCGCGASIEEIEDALNMAIKALEQEPRWIPVSEKLPEEDGEYLLFGKIYEDEENYIFIGEYDSCGEQFGIWQEQFDRRTLGCLGSEFFEYSSVIAWQPLPQPYRAESEEKLW